MRLPLSYQLPALDGSAGERGALLQDIRDRGILEASDLTAFCFKIEALLDRAEQNEAAEITQDAEEKLHAVRLLVIEAFDDLLTQLPLSADMLFAKCAHILKEMPE